MSKEPSSDLASSRAHTKVSAAINEIANVYEKRTPPPDFWPFYDAEEKALNARLVKRPITLMEIESACSIFRSKIIGKLR